MLSSRLSCFTGVLALYSRGAHEQVYGSYSLPPSRTSAGPQSQCRRNCSQEDRPRYGAQKTGLIIYKHDHAAAVLPMRSLRWASSSLTTRSRWITEEQGRVSS